MWVGVGVGVGVGECGERGEEEEGGVVFCLPELKNPPLKSEISLHCNRPRIFSL